MEHRFWKDFGKVLEGFWEAKILDFRIFFVIFSMQILECKLEGQKIEKKGFKIFLPAIFAVSAALGGRIIGWGEGKFGLNFKPGLKIGL